MERYSMAKPIKVHEQFTDSDIEQVVALYKSGKTQSEIATVFNKSRRTIGKLCNYLGLKRSVREASSIKGRSNWDSLEFIKEIREMRERRMSLPDIVRLKGIPLSSLHRLCKRHDIKNPENYAALQSERMKAAWNEEKREEASKKAKSLITNELRSFLSKQSKTLWEDPEYKAKQISKQREVWSSLVNRERLAAFRAKQSGNISKIQSILYDILKDLKIDYTPEFIVGPYNFDCLAGNFLIECQGDYWHTLEKAIRLDRAKSTYINTYHSHNYQIKYLWEHEFYCKDKIIQTLKYWFGLSDIEVIDFNFSEISIGAPTAAEYRPLLEKYHYLSNAGRGGKVYGAYFSDILIAVCVFSPLIRQNIEIEGLAKGSVLELSRLCIHPRYQKHNFASWFVSRCLKDLDKKIRAVISYCDTTFNHDGAVYKALNFKQDKIIRPDYWYTNAEGWVMHKKTLYERAVKMSMTENQYADRFEYKRVYGTEKFRYIYYRGKNA